MDFFQLNSQQIPKGYCVIRVEDSYKYLHFDNSNGQFFLREKMHGCFVTSSEIADEIIAQIKSMYNAKYNMRKVEFNAAYEEHGIIEKQIFYN